MAISNWIPRPPIDSSALVNTWRQWLYRLLSELQGLDPRVTILEDRTPSGRANAFRWQQTVVTPFTNHAQEAGGDVADDLSPGVCAWNVRDYVYLGVRRDGIWEPLGNNGYDAVATPSNTGIMRFAPHAGNPLCPTYVPKSATGIGAGKFWFWNDTDDYVTLIDPVALTATHVQLTGITGNYYYFRPTYCKAHNSVILPYGSPTSLSTCASIDVATITVNTTATITGQVGSACFNADHSRMWVSLYAADKIAEINPITLAVIATSSATFNSTAGWAGPGPLAYADEFDLLWVGQFGNTHQSLIDPNTWAITRTTTEPGGVEVATFGYNGFYFPARRCIYAAQNTRWNPIDFLTGLELKNDFDHAVDVTFLSYSPVFNEFLAFDVDSGSFTVLF